jgi:hypothetical protein
MDILKAIAPTIATLLGGPLAGLAVEGIGAAFGWDSATKEQVEEKIRSGNLSGEDIAKLKIAENEVKVRMRELDIKIEELEVQDRQSARDRETKTGGITTPVLAWAIVGSFIAMAGGLIYGKAVVDSALAGTVIGYLSAKAEQVLSYYFGSSRGSDDKNALIAKLQSRSPP